MNINMNKWVVLSAANWLRTYITNYDSTFYVWVQGSKKPQPQPSDRFEIKFLGPDIISQTKDMFTVHITMNCQVLTVQDNAHVDRHLQRVGLAQSMFVNCIPVYKYGSTDDDDASLYYPLQQISNVQTTPYGTVDVVSNIERTTVEVVYKVVIEE